MKINYLFYTLKDLSALKKGEEFLEILLTNDLQIEKTNNSEPINKIYKEENFNEMWHPLNSTNENSSNLFLFKGSVCVPFMGSVSWNKHVHANLKCFNGIHLSLNIKKNYDINKLIDIGDRLFKWSNAVYGYISQYKFSPSFGMNQKDYIHCKYPEYIKKRNGREQQKNNGMSLYIYRSNLYDGLYDPMWINYYGEPYIKEKDFHLPENSVFVGHGAKVLLSEKPDDYILCEPSFLDNIKKGIGYEWFWQNPIICKTIIPNFDRSEITKK